MNGFLQILLLFVVGIIVAAIMGLFGGGGLAYLISKILICLILAALLGMLLGWLLKSLLGGGNWRAKYEELKASFGAKDRELDGLKANLRASKAELEKTNLRFADIEAERDKHKGSFLDLQNRFENLKLDLDAERSGRLELDKELEARTSSFADFGFQLDAKDKEINRLNALLKDCEASKQEIDSLRLKLKETETASLQLPKLKAQIQDLEQEIAKKAGVDKQKAEDIARFESDIAKFDSDLKLKQTTISTLEKQLSEKERRIAALEADLSKAKADDGQSDDLSAQITNLRKELASKDQKLILLETELAKSKELASKSSEYNSQLSALRTDLSARDKQLESLKLDLDNTKKAAGDSSKYEAEIASLKSELEKKDKKYAALLADFKAADEGRTEVDNELEARAKSIADFGLQLESGKKTLAERERRIAELEFELSKAKKASVDTSKFEKEIAELKAELAARDKKYESLQAEFKALDKGRSEVDNELEARAKSIADFGLQLDSSKKELTAREKRIAELETELNKAKKSGKDSDKYLAEIKKLEARADDESWLHSRVSKDYVVQKPRIQARFLGEKIRLSGYVTPEIHERVIEKASKDYGENNVIDALISDHIVASPKWTEPALLGAVAVSDDLQDAVYDLDAKVVILSGLVANEKVKSDVEKKITKVLPKDLKLDNKLKVVGKDVKMDDLKEIKGIASVLEPVLHANGVYTFRQIACWTDDDIEQVRESLGSFKGRIEREEWISQARELHRKHYNEEPECLGRGLGFRARRAAGSKGTSAKKKSSGKPDDLTRIEGIGPKINKALLAAGIKTFKQLEAASQEELTKAINAAGITFAPSIKTWSKQAAYLVAGDEEGFLKYTDYLIAGRDLADES